MKRIPFVLLSVFTVLSQTGAISFENVAGQMLDESRQAVLKAKEGLQTWSQEGKELTKQNGLLYDVSSHSMFRNYRLRTTEPKLCDPGVKQYSGYLDVSSTKHIFFWFFEAREDPENAPLVMWLNGGPGCSSTMGLFMELGPCTITDEGRNTTVNPYSWNKHANLIFLDQPVQVGFSYDEEGNTVSTSPEAARDVYAFLELFFSRFPKYANLPFHLTGESFFGTYAPHIASTIYQKNKELISTPNPQLKHINLASLAIGNGLISPKIQFGSVADWVCDEGPYRRLIFSDPEGPECSNLRVKIPLCQSLTDACYEFNTTATCGPAMSFCIEKVWGPLYDTGLNPYDARRRCSVPGSDVCYDEQLWIVTWLNTPEHKEALGVDPGMGFESCNEAVNKAFTVNGDGMQNTALLLQELIDSGLRVLVYNGNADMLTNHIGSRRWVENLETRFKAEYSAAKPHAWFEPNGRHAGIVRSAGGGAGNITFAEVFEAGHLVPYDQPAAALDMITRWIRNVPFN